MPSFPGVDYMDIDSLFSEEELMVRQTVRDFVDEEVIPIIEEANRKEEMPMHLIPKMAEMGLFGATIKEYDLPGLNHVAYGLIMQELERGDSGLRSFASVQSGLVMYPIYTYGSQRAARLLDSEARRRRKDRLLRPDRARLRLQSRRHAHLRAQGRRLLGPQRREGVDHERLDRRRRRGLGQARRRRSAASSSRRTRPASPPRTTWASSRCARR